MFIFLSSTIQSLLGTTFHHFYFSPTLVFSQLVLNFSTLQLESITSVFSTLPNISRFLFSMLLLAGQSDLYISYHYKACEPHYPQKLFRKLFLVD